MSFDDPNSFLFGLNQFATPTSNNSPQAGGSNTTASAEQQHNGNSTLLNGMDAFPADSNHDILDGGSFADQLELWTNANFSFDGPTGHALLGDEDKEKEEAEKKDEDKDDAERAEKRARNENASNAASSFRGKGRQRDEEEGTNNLRITVPNEPTHRAHKEQAALQQQQNYFAPPSRNAEEARRPGYDQISASANAAPSERARSLSRSESKPVPVSSPAVPATNGSFAQQVNGLNNGHFAGAFNGHQAPATANGAPNQFPASQQGGPLDLSSLLALQQLVSQNPLALANLGNFNGLSPQLGALGAQLNGLSALNGHNLQQLQMQMQLQQQQQQNGSAQISPLIQTQTPQQQQPYGQFNAGFQNGWPMFNNQFSTAPPTGSMAAHVPAPSAPVVNGHNHSFREGNAHITASGSPDDDEDDKRRKDKKKRQSSSGGSDDRPKPSRHERKMSYSDGNISSESGETTSRLTAAERQRLHDERAAERDQIPPLKLIDTGNPEADAEANRLAIEEDKRRRNTAASARFRVKKKQREAALEAHTKKLDAQLADLRDEITKLRNENQWLKGLIEVRPGGKDGNAKLNGMPSAVSAPEALQAAQQLQALQQAVKIQVQKPVRSEPGTHNDRLRDTGIRPRGVGTDGQNGLLAHKRDREE